MRNLGVRLEVNVDRGEDDPFSIRRRDRFAQAFERHHIFEGERPFGAGRRSLGVSREGEREEGDPGFPIHNNDSRVRRKFLPEGRFRNLIGLTIIPAPNLDHPHDPILTRYLGIMIRIRIKSRS